MRAHFYDAGYYDFIAIRPLAVGASIARPRGLPVRSTCRNGCGGRHICRPYKSTRRIVIAIMAPAFHFCIACSKCSSFSVLPMTDTVSPLANT